MQSSVTLTANKGREFRRCVTPKDMTSATVPPPARPDRDDTASSSHGEPRSRFSPWLAAMTVVLVAFLGTLGLVAGSGRALGRLTEQEIKLPLLVVVSVVGLLGSISLVVIAFGIFRLVDRTQALGLPDGSVRAIIALLLIVLFVTMTVFLVARISGPTANANVVDVAKQVLTILGTLVTAVSSFYFGSRAASDGAKAVVSAAANSGATPGAPVGQPIGPQPPSPQPPQPVTPPPIPTPQVTPQQATPQPAGSEQVFS